jgi:hypothetical protein
VDGDLQFGDMAVLNIMRGVTITELAASARLDDKVLDGY